MGFGADLLAKTRSFRQKLSRQPDGAARGGAGDSWAKPSSGGETARVAVSPAPRAAAAAVPASAAPGTRTAQYHDSADTTPGRHDGDGSPRARRAGESERAVRRGAVVPLNSGVDGSGADGGGGGAGAGAASGADNVQAPPGAILSPTLGDLTSHNLTRHNASTGARSDGRAGKRNFDECYIVTADGCWFKARPGDDAVRARAVAAAAAGNAVAAATGAA